MGQKLINLFFTWVVGHPSEFQLQIPYSKRKYVVLVFKILQPNYRCGDFVDTLSTRTIANYTCGPYGQFLNENGTLYTMAEARCLWNKTWSPPELDPCKAICLHAHSFTDIFITIIEKKHKSLF